MKRFTSVALACSLLVLGACQQGRAVTAPDPVEPATCGTVRNLHAVGDIYLAGQPGPGDYALLKERGIKTVIDLRLDKETDHDEAKAVSAQGLTYVHLPWNGPDQLTDARLDEMRRLLREAERPLLLKCGSANRVAAGWLAYRALDEGVAVETALAEAKAVGLRTPAYEAKALDYIQRKR